MNARSNCLSGIVNGIDYEDYDPATDTHIEKNYTCDSFRREKIKNKIALQKELNLEQDHHIIMLGIVSRLTDQKGFDLIAYVMDELCRMQFRSWRLEQEMKSTKICSGILHGNIRARYRRISIIQRLCPIRYTLLRRIPDAVSV